MADVGFEPTVLTYANCVSTELTYEYVLSRAEHGDVLTNFCLYIKSIHSVIFTFSLTDSVFRLQIQILYCRKKRKYRELNPKSASSWIRPNILFFIIIVITIITFIL